MKCVTGKVCYLTKELAEEALIETRSRFHFREGNGPIAVYACEDCGEWHFTSKGPVSNVLTSTDVKKSIDARQEASYWEKKFRR